jgi:hypothetical protein
MQEQLPGYIAERREARERCAYRDGRYGHPALSRHSYIPVHRRYIAEHTTTGMQEVRVHGWTR